MLFFLPLIQDVVAGMFLVFDDSFEVGDIVTINDFRGTVMEAGIKSTRLEDAGFFCRCLWRCGQFGPDQPEGQNLYLGTERQ
jgi:small-conductance mechanosensitive channel